MLSSQLLRIGLALAMSVVLAACVNQDQGSESNEEAPAEAQESDQAESSNGGDSPAEGNDMTHDNGEPMALEAAVDAALQDLSERSGISPETISVVQAREVTWRNGALGCPEEGMMYTQALVDGFYILLSDGDSEYAYHAGRDGKPFFCPAERSEPPPADDGNPRM